MRSAPAFHRFIRARRLTRSLGRAARACALLALAGCDRPTSEGITGIEGFGERDAGEGAVLAVAVMSSDRTVTSIGLLEPDGTILRRDLVHSGSARAELATALSGDVALPTRSGDSRTLTLVDRYRTDVITRIDVERGEVLGQMRTHDRQPADAAWSSNPQDFAQVEPDLAWVSRYNPNTSVSADDPESGSDLIAIDPTALVRRDERIDLRALDATAERENPDTGEMERVRAYARPTRMVQLGRSLIVGLSRASLSYDALGPGAVARVDLDALRATPHPLEGLRNCTRVVPVADDEAAVLVACTGLLRQGTKREHSGLARLALRDGELTTLEVWRASEHPEAALAVHGLVSLGGTRAVAFASGQSEAEAGRAEHDALYLVDLADGSQRKLLEAQGNWVLGEGSYDPRSATLLVPDASTDRDGRPTAGVHRFDVPSGERPELRDTLELHATLPPWQIAPL